MDAQPQRSLTTYPTAIRRSKSSTPTPSSPPFVPIVQTSPQPSNQYEWNIRCSHMSGVEVSEAFSYMHLVEINHDRVVDPSMTAPRSKFDSVSELTSFAVKSLSTPIMCADFVRTHIRRNWRHFNFAVFGPRGNGRRTAVLDVATWYGYRHVTITPPYRRGYLILAMDYARVCNKFLIYFDDFDRLAMDRDFVTDYQTICATEVNELTSLTRFVIAVPTEEPDPQLLEFVALSCYPTQHFVNRAPTTDVLRKHIESLLLSKSIKVVDFDPKIHATELHGAITGASYADVTEFVSAIVFRAMWNASIDMNNSTTTYTVSWKVVRTMYVRLDASAASGGVCRCVIPRDQEFISGTQ